MISILTISNISLHMCKLPIHIFFTWPRYNWWELFAKVPKYREPISINWKHNCKILMDSVADYARKRAKREKEDLDTHSEWVKSVRSLMQIRIKKLNGSMSTGSTAIFKDPNVAKHMSLLHDKYVVVSADKAPNNVVFVCKSHYVECLIKELGIDNSLGNPTYTPTTLTKEETLDNHMSFYIPLDSRLQSYPDTNYSRGGVNQMWILKNSKDMLEYIQTRPRSSCKSIKTFDFSTLCTTISHSKLKDRLRGLVLLCFIKKNGQRRYKYLVLGRDISSFIKKKNHHSDSSKNSLKLISSTFPSFWLTTYL